MGILCLFVVCIIAQAKSNPQKAITTTNKTPTPVKQAPKKGTKVFLEYADVLEFDKTKGPDYQVLRGSVRFRQDNMHMFCDSAYFYDKTNSLEAFSNIRMEQGDTLFVYGDYLHYDGNEQLAKLRRNVKMENRNVTLLTDSLNFDRRINIGYFFQGGVISDLENELTSVYGQYSPSTKQSFFRNNVKLKNKNYNLFSDTLYYNTATKVADITSPTTIISDSNTIYTSKGWYNTNKETSMLLNRSLIVNKKKTLTGDTIRYFRNIGIGKVYGHMHLRDTLNKADLFGNYGFYNEKTNYAYSTDSAWIKEYSRPDTMYVHADSLFISEPKPKEKLFLGYHNVRFFSTESQGVADSMRYWSKDSVLRLYKNPVLWNTKYQISGDTINSYFNDSTIEKSHVIGYAFVATQEDSIGGFYNQLAGKELWAFFKEKEVRQVDVNGNVQSIFYPIDSDSIMIGLNQAESSYLRLFTKNRKVEKLIMWPSPIGSLTPMNQIKSDQKYLKNYRWYSDIRPLSKTDIFRKTATKAEPIKRIQRRTKDKAKAKTEKVEAEKSSTIDKKEEPKTPQPKSKKKK